MSGQIYELVPLVMESIDKIGKEKKANISGGGSYSFRGIDDALNHTHPAFVKHGVSVTFNVKDHKYVTEDRANKAALIRVWVTAEVGFHAPDGSSLSCTTVGEGVDYGGDKATNKAMSAAMKYALFFGLVIPVDKKAIDDGDNDASPPEPRHNAPSAAPRGQRPTQQNLKDLWNDWLTYNKEDADIFRKWIFGHTGINPGEANKAAAWTQDALEKCRYAIKLEKGEPI